MFSNKPTTVKGVFDKAIKEVAVIRDKQNAEIQRLEDEQKAREEKFTAETEANRAFKDVADQERNKAVTAIENFTKLFGLQEK